MSSKAKEEPIFLNNGSILPWERPLPPGIYSMLDNYDGKTNVMNFIGYGVFNCRLDSYRVNASAAVYRASILPTTGFLRSLPEGAKPIDSLLFSGGIQVFQSGKIPGTEIDGEDFILNGRIWTSIPYESQNPQDALETLILGKNKKLELAIVKGIILGYQTQKNNAEDAESRARHQAYKDGALDHHESTFGTFSSVPFNM